MNRIFAYRFAFDRIAEAPGRLGPRDPFRRDRQPRGLRAELVPARRSQ
jgi:hypothetical protein